MKLTPGAKTLLVVAAAEAAFIDSVELEPEHIFLGFLKIGDVLQKGQLPPALLEGDDAELVTGEVAGLVEFWKAQGISTKQLRRPLRRLVSVSQEKSGEFSGHRSERGRELFIRAEALSREREEERLGLMALLSACTAFESPMLATLFTEFDIDPDGLIKAVNAWEAPPPQAIEAAGGHPLAKFGRDLTEMANQGMLGPIIGRDEEIKDIARILTQRGKNNPLLLGDAGVGKTAVVEGLAAYAAQEDAKESIRRLHFVEITMTALVAGAMYRGQFEKRVQEVIEAASKDKDLVLFIDELHTMMGAGAASAGALDAANILKPALARRELRCIGATTTDEYRRHIEQDGALARRFQIVWIDEPNRAETTAILTGIRPVLESHHQIEIPEEVIKKAASLSDRFITDGHQPDKAITLIDEACARRKLLTIHNRALDEQTSTLEVFDLGDVIAQRTQIPVEVILSSDDERLLTMESELRKRVLGQDHALEAVAQAIRISRSGLRSPGKPAVLLFAGPTGTGKSELAKALSEYLFYDPDRLITLDMSEFQEEHAIAKIIGSPPGYVGFGEEPKLVREIRLHPYSVVLLDEIEKAHPEILTIFLQVFDEGRLTDARGRKINCSEAIFIMTSNLGSGVKPKAQVGFKLGQENGEKQIQNQVEEHIRRAITANLRPELINRIQKIVVFKSLSKGTLYKILEIYLSGINKRLREREITVELDDSARDFLIAEGYSPEYGARHLSRAFERWIAEPLSREILGGSLTAGSTATFKSAQNALSLEIETGGAVKTRMYESSPGGDQG